MGVRGLGKSWQSFMRVQKLENAVNPHVFRISNRTGLANGNTVLEVENNLMTVVPSKWKKAAHHLLILQGRYVCKSRNPDCVNCVIARECEYPDKSTL